MKNDVGLVRLFHVGLCLGWSVGAVFGPGCSHLVRDPHFLNYISCFLLPSAFHLHWFERFLMVDSFSTIYFIMQNGQNLCQRASGIC